MSIQIRKASADDFELILTEIDKNFIYEERREREKEKESKNFIFQHISLI